MQVDPSHRRATAARHRPTPRRPVGVRSALLPLAFGLLTAGLLSACTVSTVSTASTVGLGPATLTHAEQGDVDAMVRLALMHETGHGAVTQDRSEMLRWLALASKLGSGPASYRLFRHYEEQPDGGARALRFKELAQRQGYYGPIATSNNSSR